MDYQDEFDLGVRNLIEFAFESGDIDLRYKSSVRAVEGTKIHQKIQKKYSNNENYFSEEVLSIEEVIDGVKFNISGRVDGIWKEKNIIIEEIKSTRHDLDDIDENFNHHHWAQVMIYGYMYAKLYDIERIKLRLIYVDVDTEETKCLVKEHGFSCLEDFTFQLLSKYAVWAKKINSYRAQRNRSLEDLEFIFPNYRKGQRSLMVGVYRSIQKSKNILIEAPTGIGKTISTLFPAIKSLKTIATKKVFYMTAKGVVRNVAENTIKNIVKNGAKIKTLTITAKDKICLNQEVICNPEKCMYAKGHYDRLGKARENIMEQNYAITKDVILRYAEKYRVCPFELQLDIALWVDVIIGDYNYVFDPKVYLRRFFESDQKEYVFLIDEAHNLIERSRKMYSFEISKNNILDVRKIVGKYNKNAYKRISKLNSVLLELKNHLEENGSFEKVCDVDLDALYYDFFNITKALDKWLQENHGKEDYKLVLEFYFKCHEYIRLYDYFDESYVSRVIRKGKSDVIYSCECLDTSHILSNIYKRSISSVLFSATLTPMSYYKNLLGLDESLHMQLESPFDRKNIEVSLVTNISTYYNERKYYYKDLSKLVKSVCQNNKGNYIVFLPSFEYMEELEAYLHIDGYEIIRQARAMNESERESFVNEFKSVKKGKIGLAVIGGLFSEGVDFVGDELIGVFVVGVGMPKISYQRDMLKEYFEKIYGAGFDYAYVYPGMNKVLQAGGRLIRTEEDKGKLYLIDKRYSRKKYYDLLPKHWK